MCDMIRFTFNDKEQKHITEQYILEQLKNKDEAKNQLIIEDLVSEYGEKSKKSIIEIKNDILFDLYKNLEIKQRETINNEFGELAKNNVYEYYIMNNIYNFYKYIVTEKNSITKEEFKNFSFYSTIMVRMYAKSNMFFEINKVEISNNVCTFKNSICKIKDSDRTVCDLTGYLNVLIENHYLEYVIEILNSYFYSIDKKTKVNSKKLLIITLYDFILNNKIYKDEIKKINNSKLEYGYELHFKEKQVDESLLNFYNEINKIYSNLGPDSSKETNEIKKISETKKISGNIEINEIESYFKKAEAFESDKEIEFLTGQLRRANEQYMNYNTNDMIDGNKIGIVTLFGILNYYNEFYLDNLKNLDDDGKEILMKYEGALNNSLLTQSFPKLNEVNDILKEIFKEK